MTLEEGNAVFDYERIDGQRVAKGSVRLRVPFGGTRPPRLASLGTPPEEGNPDLQATSKEEIVIEGRTYRRRG